MQSRVMSPGQAITNVVVGFWVALGVQIAAFPLFGIAASAGDHLALSGIFTIASVARTYILRRGFEAILR